MTAGELIEVARGLRALGAAGFSFRGCEVTFYEPLPLEMQKPVIEQDEDEDDEDKQKKLEKLRKKQMEADLYGSS